MKKLAIRVIVVLIIGLLSNNLFAQVPPGDTSKKTPSVDTTKKAVIVPAAKDSTTKDIVATLANVAEESTLVAAIKTANLETDLKATGPFTVLAPNNDAFAALPKSKTDSLMKDPVKLETTLKAHVIAGRYDKTALIKALTDGKGKATLKTIDGQTLTLSVLNKKLAITDSQGTVVEVTSFDTPASNGLIDGVNGVLMSK
jgi:uncharacterized surface protein with fasciclin (FAS1) repeats